jgi:peptide/nickel transport system ATP-binding protein
MLEAIDLAYRHPGADRAVLGSFSLTLAAGERVGLVGPSGCGKTTVGRLLAGHLRPHRGRVLMDGAPLPVRGACPVQLVHQAPETAIDPRFTGRRIVENGGPVDGTMLEAFAIAPAWLDRHPVELSGGELQRLALVRALRPTTRVLVADEITAQLDALTQADIWAALDAHATRTGLAVLIISHDAGLLARTATRVVHFR